MNIISRVAGCAVLVAVMGASALAAVAAADANWHVTQRHRLGGSGGWDYLAFEPSSQRLFISRSDRVIVLDTKSGKPAGEIANLSGVHGIAFAPALHRGFISNGQGDSVTIFDPATLKVEQTVAVGAQNPDGIVYDPYSRRVFTFNGHSNNASAIDAKTGKLLGQIALPGKPEFPVSDGHGRVFDNIESTNELVVIDPVAMKVTAVWPLKDCEEPSGLALDNAHHRLFSVCQNNIMAVTDATNGKSIASIPIGAGPDATSFDATRGLVFSSNGQDGTLTVVQQDDADHYRVLANVPTQKSARTMALDQASGHVFLPAAEFGPRPAATAADPHPRPAVQPGSFTMLEVGMSAGR